MSRSGPLLIPMKVRSWGCPKFDPPEADLRGQMPEISPPDRRRSNSTVPEIEAGERRFHPTMPENDLVEQHWLGANLAVRKSVDYIQLEMAEGEGDKSKEVNKVL